MSGCAGVIAAFGGDVTLRVWGTPGPQGSKTLMRGRMIESSRKVGPWRDAVRGAALALVSPWGNDWTPLDGPLRVSMTFTLARPLKPRWELPAVRPDLDKLARSTCDALSGVIWHDDARVVEFDRLAKVYAGSDDRHALPAPGAWIIVRQAR